MATCFRVPICIPTSIPASPSRSPSPRFHPTRLKTLRTLNAIGNPNIPMPPFNPKDPFLSKLASVGASSPETLLNPSSNPDNLPLSDASPTHHGRGSSARSGRGDRRRPSPPDLASALFDARIVYIGMPLVPVVSELIVAELLYLSSKPYDPIYVYINSTGTTREDGETVAMESEGFAIYDAMMNMRCEIYTLALGEAIGQACLLLAAGTPGKRFMMPHAKVMIQQPRVPSTGLIPATDVLIHAKEVIHNRDTLVKLLAIHTGNSEERVAKVMSRGPYYMDPLLAKEFGVIDEVYSSDHMLMS